MKLNVRAVGITCALMWGFGLFVITWWIYLWEGGDCSSIWIERVYLGYCISPIGSLIGLAWGLVDGFIGGIIFAWLYNKMVDLCPAKEAKPNGNE